LNQRMVLPLRIPFEKMHQMNSYEKAVGRVKGRVKINVGKQEENLIDLSEKKDNDRYYDPCFKLMKIPASKRICYHAHGGVLSKSITTFCTIMQKYAANNPKMAAEIINHVEGIVKAAVVCASSPYYASSAIDHHLSDHDHHGGHVHIGNYSHGHIGNYSYSHGPYVNPGHAIRKILHNGTNATYHQHYYGNYSGHHGNYPHYHYGNYSNYPHYGNYSDHHYYGNYSGHHYYGNYSDHHFGNYSVPHYYGNYSDHHGHYNGNYSNHLHPEIVADDHHAGLVHPHIEGGFPHPHTPVVVSSHPNFDSHHPVIISSGNYSDHHFDDHAIGTIVDHRGGHFHGNYTHWGNYSGDHDHHVHPEVVGSHVEHELLNPHVVGTPHGGHGHHQVIVGHLG